MICDSCKGDFNRLRSVGNQTWVCIEKCISKYRSRLAVSLPAFVQTMFIEDYGNESVKRVEELGRRVVLPDMKPGGGYYLGRRGENGKIQDRSPRY